jgi:hypothetical protein
MKLEKALAVKNIQTKKFVDGYQLENTEDQQDYDLSPELVPFPR